MRSGSLSVSTLSIPKWSRRKTLSSTGSSVSIGDMRSSISKESTAKVGQLSRCSSSVPSSKGWVKNKKSVPPTDLAKVLDNYHAQEDEYLMEFERMQRSIRSPEFSSTDGLLTDDQISSSALDPPIAHSLSSKSLAPPSLYNKRRGMNQPPPTCPSPQTDLLGSFCHLMNYVVHLRRDNRHLRRQVACLTEMRKIEELKHDLLTASCQCKSIEPLPAQLNNKDIIGLGTVSKGISKNSSFGSVKFSSLPEEESKKTSDSNRKTSDEQQLNEGVKSGIPDVGGLMNGRGGVPSTPPTDGRLSAQSNGSKLFARISERRNSLLRKNLIPSQFGSTARFGAATKFGSTPNIIIMNSTTDKSRSAFSSRFQKSRQQKNTSIKEGAAEALATPPLSAGLLEPGVHFRSPIFSLPDLREMSPVRQGPSRKHMPLPPLPAGGASDSDDQPVFAEVSLPYLPVESDSRRRSLARRSTNNSPPTSNYPRLMIPTDQADKVNMDRAPASPMSERSTTSVNSNRGSLLDKIGKIGWRRKDTPNHTPSQMCNSLTVPSSDGSEFHYGIYNKKAIVKKRKRKISESDSVASSERSGKPYKAIDLPIHNSTDSPASRPTASIDIDALQRQISPEYARKMSDWAEKRAVSSKGQESKKSWLRKPKQIKIEQNPQDQQSKPYFQLSLDQDDSSCGRQNTIIYNEPTSPCSLVTPSIAISLAGGSHSASESNISQMDGNSRSPSPRNSKLSLLPANIKSKIENLPGNKRLSLGGDDLSMGGSIITMSEDSVFGSQEFLPGLEDGNGLLGTLLSMQEKNSKLIHQLKDKSHECDSINEQMEQLEKQFSILKGRFRMETNLKKIVEERSTPLNLVPLSLLDDLDVKLKWMDEEIKSAKGNAFKAQQGALEAHSKEQSSNQKYLDNIEKLQKTNFQILQRDMTELSLYDGEIQRRLDVMPTYDTLYSFAMNLIRKLRQLRGSVLERVAGASRLDLEMMQTQSSLLLAHAQIERQKLELKTLGDKKQILKRPNSYHGDDLVVRLVKPELSFYLPFKLQGTRNSKCTSTEALKDAVLNENRLEEEFIRLFDSALIMDQQSEHIPVRDIGSIHHHSYHCPTPTNNIQVSPLDTRKTAWSPIPKFMSKVRNMTNPLTSIKQNEAMKSTERAVVIMRHNPVSGSHDSSRPLSCADSVPNTSWQPLNRQRQMLSLDAIHANNHCEHVVAFSSVSAGLGRDHESFGSQEWEHPSYQSKAPEPLRLGNLGQVRAIAAAFDVSTTSAPTTPLSKTAPHLIQSGSKPNSPLPPPRRTLMTPRQIQHTSPVAERHYDTPANSVITSRLGTNQQEQMDIDSDTPRPEKFVVKMTKINNNLCCKSTVCRPYASTKLPCQRSVDSPTSSGTSFGQYLSPPSQLVRPTGMMSPLAIKRPSPCSSLNSSNHYESLSLTSQKAVVNGPSSAIPHFNKMSPTPAKPRVYVPKNAKQSAPMDKSSTPESLTTSSSSGGGRYLRRTAPGVKEAASLGTPVRRGVVSPAQKDIPCSRAARSQIIQSPRMRVKNDVSSSVIQEKEVANKPAEAGDKSKRTSWIMRFKSHKK